jgi:HTH-type transcriptional regulator/antitoxin HigA
MEKQTDNTHPGAILKKELESRGIKQKDFADELQISSSQFNEIVNGKRNVSVDLAVLLEAALGLPAIFWLNLQTRHDLENSRSKGANPVTNRLEKWGKMREFIPYNFFKKFNVITGDLVKDEKKIKEVYRINAIEDLASKISSLETSERYRKTESRAVNKVNMVGWLNLVDYKAREQKNVAAFNGKKRDVLIPKLREALSGSNVIENSTKILKEAGIKLVIQEKPDQTPVDGVAFWCDKNPAIGLTRRYNRLDNFAFTLFHELGHVYLHETKMKKSELSIDQIDNLDDYSYITKRTEEIEANNFAANNLIPQSAWEKFNSEHFNFSDNAIEGFANEIGIHPAIVVGRLRFENPILYRRRFRISNEIE